MTLAVLIILILCAVGAAGFTLYWYAFRFEPVNFMLSEVEIFIGRDGKSHNTGYSVKRRDNPVLTILHLSDFHLRKDRKGSRLFHFVQGLKVLLPDLILITGDLVEKNEYFPYLIEMLSGFNSRLGKYAVFGVHDYYDKTAGEFTKNMLKKRKDYRRENDVKELAKKLDSIGVRVLRNEQVKHRTGNLDEIQIIGLEDAMIDKTDIDLAFRGLNKNYLDDNSRKDIKNYFTPKKTRIHTLNNSSRLRICITHTPDMNMIAKLAGRDVDIILCGHTHGGQVRLPGVGAIITGSKIRAKYASGLFYFKDFVLYTSRGLGEGRYSPFRFYCQPEASLIRVYYC
jgi:predicted MPP superfamily phosphohydrolase